VEVQQLDKIKSFNQASQEAEVGLNRNLNFHRLVKLSKMMVPNRKVADFLTTSRMDSQVRHNSNNQAMAVRFKVKATNKLVKTNIISIWMLRFNHLLLKIIMVSQSKVGA